MGGNLVNPINFIHLSFGQQSNTAICRWFNELYGVIVAIYVLRRYVLRRALIGSSTTREAKRRKQVQILKAGTIPGVNYQRCRMI